ncbi:MULTISPECIES: hypothetical protein [Sorangium]|uniref:Cytochrome c domain-containing protein n=1 Tax=Sorangium cellulosum TaxID=56 RepID=A0A4P2QIK9_SORCE|nr:MULTISPECIES: hypothetical protein [Sorangium]AUX29749.1 uncharacterized protein SOCE836_018420 [Sorangium cellulosum]WCQ89139.1 hypothetical protein NQZ70_01826 [Sorangium sp. Soce836]
MSNATRCRPRTLAGLATLVLAFTGACGSTDDDIEPVVTDGCGEAELSSTWEGIQRVILAGYQCSNATCHGGASAPAGGLDLRPEAAYASLVNVPANAPLPGETGVTLRLYPGEQELSSFYKKIEAATLGVSLPAEFGAPMPPPPTSPVSKEHLEALRLWIRAGAPETGIVQGTERRLGCDLPDDFDANKLPPLAPPPAGEGLQFYSSGWRVPAGSENEVCYATYYDLTTEAGEIPAWAEAPCRPEAGGPEETCLAINENLLHQDPQSHHSIIYSVRAVVEPDDASWGQWTCLGGDLAGAPCDPTMRGVSASQSGADCGPRSACTSPPRDSVACWDYLPSIAMSPELLTPVGGAQEPVSGGPLHEGVYDTLPRRGYIFWNSHGFNLTRKDTTIEHYLNLRFARPESRKFMFQGFGDSRFIFAMDVPPFESREYCAGFTLPRYSRVTDISSHMHQRGVQWRTWEPPQDPECSPDNGCLPNDDPPDYTSTIYSDPVRKEYKTPLALDEEDDASRTFKYCAVFDNGLRDPATVKRCEDGRPCNLVGGYTTDDEMLFFIGHYYIDEP